MAALYVDKKNRQLDPTTVKQLALSRLANTGIHPEYAEAKIEAMKPAEIMSWAVDDDGNFPDELVGGE